MSCARLLHTRGVPEPPAGRPSAKAAAKQATRSALLLAATRLLVDSPAVDPIHALRPVEIVRRADPPRSTGAFYNIWPTHADFRRDLLRHLLDLNRFSRTRDPVVERFTELLAAADGPSAAVVLRLVADVSFERFAAEQALRLKQALWASNGADDDVRALLAALYGSVSDTMTPFYDGLLARSGRRMRPPHTVQELAVVLAALHEGLSLRHSVQPEAVPEVPPPAAAADQLDGDTTPWTLFASTAWTLFVAMTEPG